MMLFIFPSIITTVLMIKLPESPKFYLINGYKKECLIVLQKMFIMNTGESSANYDVSFNYIL